MGLFKNLTNKKLLLMILGSLSIAIITAILFLNNIFNNQTVFIIISTICLIILMSSINSLTTKLVYKKYANKNNNPKEYQIKNFDEIEKMLKSKAKVTTYEYGTNYLLIIKDVAYRIFVVNDNELYFNKTKTEETKENPDLKNCKFFYGFEIFKTADETIIPKIALYTFQTNNIYYTGFYLKDDILIQANYEEPKEVHASSFEYFLNLIQ